MRRSSNAPLRIMAGLVACLGLLAAWAMPATAKPRAGWMLPTVASQHGDRVFTSIAWHCGARPFGVYRFKNAVHEGDRRGHVVFKVRIAPDGSAHRPRFVRFGGRLSLELRRETLHVLNHARFRHVAAPAPVVESVWPDGSLQASRPFDPVRVARARC